MSPRIRSAAAIVVLLIAVASLSALAPKADAQQSFQRISGEGSSWAAGAIDAIRVNVKQFGITVDYNPSGSSAGRKNYLNGTVDFAASDIPFQFKPEDGSAPENPAKDSYAYIPVTAGGTSFMYNLKINGQRVTNLRLSGENVAKIFTGVITSWDDPALKADNPGLAMPARKIVPVVRSDGSGSSAQFTRWMIFQHKGIWDAFCQKSGRAPKCGFTSFYPTIAGMIAQAGDLGVAGYVAQNFAEGAIGYVNYSFAIGARFPVAKMLNAAGFYTEPTPEGVAVSLLKARINTDENSDEYLTQILDDVYRDPDPRSYQLSSYSYFILPTKIGGQFNEAKGRTLGAFAYYAMCQAQQQSASLGYSPLPINLVQASFEQIQRIPGVVVQDINIQNCKNPTFSPDGTNTLAKNAPQPQECDKRGTQQCVTGSGGAKQATTSASGGGGGTAGGPAAAGTTGGAAQGGATGGGSATGGAGASPDGVVADGTTEVCDPDTGACSGGGAGGSLELAGGGSAQAAGATSTVLKGSGGWSSAQTLLIVVLLLTGVLVVGPPLLWRRLQQADESKP